ncbi:MAG: hypothetical protein J6S51_02270 [Kiritimatiellae bacterium]|nr:hypothetical protein [Kiritimatiellia bacterium]
MKHIISFFSSILSLALFAATSSEIKVSFTPDSIDYVSGERIRGIVDVLNASPRKVSVGYANSKDKLIIEVFRADDRSQIEKSSSTPVTARFVIEPNQGQKLEVFLADHFPLLEERRYLVRPVLVHGGHRYEGMTRTINVVTGMKQVAALQLFEGHDQLRRHFELVRWSRNGTDHIFLAARDEGSRWRNWVTTDLGSFLRVTPPVISIMPSGVVTVLHRFDPETFVRSEFWSVPKGLELISREKVQDPETAGQNRVRELYNTPGNEIKPPKRRWWEIWK